MNKTLTKIDLGCTGYDRLVFGKTSSLVFEKRRVINTLVKRNQLKRDQCFAAARKGDQKGVKLLLQEGVSIHGSEKEGNTLLHVAVQTQNAAMVAFLVQEGANPSLYYNKKSPLDLAKEGKNQSILQFLEGGTQKMVTPSPPGDTSGKMEKVELPFSLQSSIEAIRHLLLAYEKLQDADREFIADTNVYVQKVEAHYLMYPQSQDYQSTLKGVQNHKKTLEDLVAQGSVPQFLSAPDEPRQDPVSDKLSLQPPLKMTEQLFQQQLDKYIGLGEQAFDEKLKENEKKGHAVFAKQFEMKKQDFVDQIENAQQQDVEKISKKQREMYQEVLDQVLKDDHFNVQTEISPDLIQQIQQTIDTKIGPQLQKEMDGLLQGHHYQKQVQQLQDTILERIKERQQQMVHEMIYAQEEQKQIKDKQDPMYQKYEAKQRKLSEQQALFAHEATGAFYTAIEKVFGAKLMSAMMLAEGMVKHEDTKTHKASKFTGAVLGGLCEGIPIVGGVVGSVVNFGIEEGTAALKDRAEKKKVQRTQDSVIRFKDAMVIAELAARRVAQSYSKHIKESSLISVKTQAAGQKAADLMYDYMKKGEMKKIAQKSIEEKIAVLVEVVQQAGQTATGVFSKTGGIFKKAVEAAPLSPTIANSNEMQALRKDLQSITDKTEYQNIISKFRPKEDKISSLTTKEMRNLALEKWSSRIRETMVAQHLFTMTREQKVLKIVCLNTENAKKILIGMSDHLTALFDGNVVDDCALDSSALLVMARTSIVAERLESVFLKSGMRFEK